MTEKFILLTLMLKHRKDERGATATEYALLVALIAIAIAVAVGLFGTALSNFFDALDDKVDTWTTNVA